MAQKEKRIERRVNRAVQILQRNESSFIPHHGLITSHPVTKEMHRAAKVMALYGSAYINPSSPYNPYTGAKSSTGRSTRYGSLIGTDYQKLQQKSLQAWWDSANARAIVKSLVTYTVNKGLPLESTPNRQLLNADDATIDEFRMKAEAIWNMWASSPESSYTLEGNYNTLEQIAATHFFLFGETFRHRILTVNQKRQLGFMIKLYYPPDIRQPLSNQVQEAESRGNRVIDGIEVNSQGRNVAIYVKTAGNQGNNVVNTYYQRIPIYTRSGFKQIDHLRMTSPNNPIGVRGEPVLASALQEFDKLATLELSEIDSAILNSTIAGIQEGDVDASSSANKSFVGIGRRDTGVVYENGAVPETITLNDEWGRNYAQREVSGGGFVIQGMTPGYKYNTVDTKRPNLNIPIFIDHLFQGICASTANVGAEIVNKKFSSSYSAARGTIQMSWYSIRQYVAHLSQSNQMDYATVINNAVGMGLITAEGWDDPLQRKAWLRAHWSILPQPSLNPLQEAKASELRVGAGLSTREMESMSYNGSTASENLSRLAVENEALAKANAPLADPAQSEIIGEE